MKKVPINCKQCGRPMGLVAVLREHGWWDPNIYSDPCRMCGLFPWDLLPLSKLSDGVCGYCYLSKTI